MIKCQCCGKSTTNPKYCSRSCAATLNNSKYIKNPPKVNPKSCKKCQKVWQPPANNSASDFCSRICKSQYLFDTGQIKSPPILKDRLVTLNGHKCSVCGIKNWCDKPLTMILDHIDGNSDNNHPTNLRLVCSNCDSQLPTYKAKNIGNGRHKRRERYANGQSH